MREPASKVGSRENASEDQGSELRDEVGCLQFALRFVPLVNPVDHAKKCKGGGAGADGTFKRPDSLPLILHLGNQIFHEMNVFLLARVDAFTQGRRQWMILMQHHSDLAIARAEDDFEMQANQSAQAFLGADDAAHWRDYALLGQFHGVIHDLEQDFVFALKVVVQSALAQLERGGDVVHGSRVVPALLEQTSGGT